MIRFHAVTYKMRSNIFVLTALCSGQEKVYLKDCFFYENVIRFHAVKYTMGSNIFVLDRIVFGTGKGVFKRLLFL